MDRRLMRGGRAAPPRRFQWLMVAGVVAVGCQSNLPVPATTSHANELSIPVPYPPPPARAEVIPEMPIDMKSPVWVDGDWQWKGRRWVWQPGQWVVPYPGSLYAPPKAVRLSDGTIGWYPGKWVLEKK
jgi:hypothetical protein